MSVTRNRLNIIRKPARPGRSWNRVTLVIRVVSDYVGVPEQRRQVTMRESELLAALRDAGYHVNPLLREGDQG